MLKRFSVAILVLKTAVANQWLNNTQHRMSGTVNIVTPDWTLFYQ